jgi:protoporphyrinogen oxidase
MSDPESTPSSKPHVIIAGGGPAGLTSAAELVENGCRVDVLEKDPDYVGGIARTVHYKGYRFDIGGHRFFSKSREITEWWKRRLPDDFISVRRLSRIYYDGKFFDYPLKAMNAFFNLGPINSFLCALSYLKVRLLPIKPEKSFQDWVTNRFGHRLFSIFFKTYTEKVWGMPCDQISADWAAQRIKGLSLIKAVYHALMPQRGRGKDGQVVKTLIDEFEYPRLGPGMMWEKTRSDIRAAGSEVHHGLEVVRIEREGNKVSRLVTRSESGEERSWEGDAFVSSVPLKETVLCMEPPFSEAAQAAARDLKYRDFLTVALMVRRSDLFPDNWIYVHDPGVKLGRIQNFNNWSEEMIPEKGVTCLGLEYFCFEGDGLWTMADEDLIELGKKELQQLNLVQSSEIFDGAVVRMPKAYPVYDDSYQASVETIRQELESLTNLEVAGRNGMHKYNNQDHSMMTALLAARNLMGADYNVWNVNTDAEYHEAGESGAESKDPDQAGRLVPQKIKDS